MEGWKNLWKTQGVLKMTPVLRVQWSLGWMEDNKSTDSLAFKHSDKGLNLPGLKRKNPFSFHRYAINMLVIQLWGVAFGGVGWLGHCGRFLNPTLGDNWKENTDSRSQILGFWIFFRTLRIIVSQNWSGLEIPELCYTESTPLHGRVQGFLE